ncbi:tRNA lysidine(34) synthetase TilS [Candidatus Peregrinibacteria bacterium]|nr:tRNA lysidine(34) synthetase TilS [Candidatus Peregrinibacteria bacterium]
MKKDFHEIIQKFLPKKCSLVAAFSGGPDSVYLLEKLNKLNKTYKFKIIVAHFNHKLRGKDSENDLKFAEATSKKHNLLFECGAFDIKKYAKENKLNLEDACRAKRYKFLEKIRKKHNAKAILTAHHLDDNIETFFINLLRGSGIQGLKSMQIQNGFILRPLLYTSKEEILDFLKRKKLKYRIDKSNYDKTFLRNEIRLDLIPAINKIQPKFKDVFIHTWNNINEINEFLDDEAAKWMAANHQKNKLEFSRNNYLNLTAAVQTKIIQKIFQTVHGSVIGLSKDLISRLTDHIKTLQTGKKAPFGKNHYLVLTKKTFKIVKYKA